MGAAGLRRGCSRLRRVGDQGLKHEAIPTSATDALCERMQKQKSLVEYRKYSGLDHDPLVFGSFRD
jgi:hypothetical protein